MDNDKKIEESRLIGGKIHKLESELLEKAQETTKIQNEKRGGKISTYWTNINKNIKPRDIIQQLKIPGTNPTKSLKRSKKMAKIGWKAHEDLLTASIHPDGEVRKEIMKQILEEIREEAKLGGEAKNSIGKLIEEKKVKTALKKSTNRSAVGINGIPYMLIPVIIGSNKTTVSVGTSNNEYYPLYISIGNIFNTHTPNQKRKQKITKV